MRQMAMPAWPRMSGSPVVLHREFEIRDPDHSSPKRSGKSFELRVENICVSRACVDFIRQHTLIHASILSSLASNPNPEDEALLTGLEQARLSVSHSRKLKSAKTHARHMQDGPLASSQWSPQSIAELPGPCWCDDRR